MDNQCIILLNKYIVFTTVVVFNVYYYVFVLAYKQNEERYRR